MYSMLQVVGQSGCQHTREVTHEIVDKVVEAQLKVVLHAPFVVLQVGAISFVANAALKLWNLKNQNKESSGPVLRKFSKFETTHLQDEFPYRRR